MQKLVFALCVLLSSVAGAQDYKPFTVNLAAGFAAPANVVDINEDSKSGFVYSVEPQYRLANNITVGVRFEQAFILRPEYIDKNIVFTTKTKSIMSAALTANYDIAISSKLRPYVGLGVGLYYTSPSEQTYRTTNVNVSYPLPTTTAIGGLGRVGVKYGTINLEVDYNLVSDTSITSGSTNLTLMAKNSYLAAKVGFTIGSRK